MKRCVFPLLLTFFFASCDSGDNPTDDFDRSAMLSAYASKMIQPAFTDLVVSNDGLFGAVDQFVQSPSLFTLENMQQKWTTAYLAWQNANSYNFGPAGEAGTRKGLVEEIGTFPASTTKIEDRISSGVWNFNDFDRDARGFLAMEYLIFRRDNNDAALVDAFINSANRRNFLKDLSGDLNDRIDLVQANFQGDYFMGFIENDGTDVGSSTSVLYNEFVKSFEALKNFKMGLPLGKRPGQVQTEPQLVECYYSGISRAALVYEFSNCVDFWYGRVAGGEDFTGFREYLLAVEGGPALVESTEAQITKTTAAMYAIPDSPDLSELIAQNNPQVDSFYTELQKLTRYFKSDMSSVLGISITYASGDGD